MLIVFVSIIIIALTMSIYEKLIDKIFIITKFVSSKHNFHCFFQGDKQNYLLLFPGIMSREKLIVHSSKLLHSHTGMTVIGFMYIKEAYVDMIKDYIIQTIPKTACVTFLGFSYGGTISLITLSRVLINNATYKKINLILYKTFDCTLNMNKYHKGVNKAMAFFCETITFGKFAYDNATLLKHVYIDNIAIIVNTRDEIIPYNSAIDNMYVLINCHDHSIKKTNISYFEENLLKSEKYKNCKFNPLYFLFGHHMYFDYDLIKHILDKLKLV